MAATEHDPRAYFHANAPQSAHLMMSFPAHPEAQDASVGEPLGHEQVVEEKSAPCSTAFGTLFMSSL